MQDMPAPPVLVGPPSAPMRKGSRAPIRQSAKSAKPPKLPKISTGSSSSSSGQDTAKFELDLNFVHQMQYEPEPWCADPATGKPDDMLAASVYYRTYARNGERWFQCVQRVVEGTFRIQQRHCLTLRKCWSARDAQHTAQEMYRRIFKMKFLPPGRGLWAMGTPIVEEKGLAAALFNCGFISTKNLDKDPTGPFCFLMDASMLGVGVGIDMRGAGKLKVFAPTGAAEIYVVPDSREGWVESLRVLIRSYARSNRAIVDFDYSRIRKEGAPLKGFGGVCAGSAPLRNLHSEVRAVLDKSVGGALDSRGIADICNLIGVAVVSGNIRRTAEILFGSPDDRQFINLKNYELNPERQGFGWTSNNSICAELGMDYSEAADRIQNNGEPGFIWLQNARAYSRMRDSEKTHKDSKVEGANPCVEISLCDGELCNLVETFPNHHKDLADYLETLRYAFLYAKTVTLLSSHWERTNEVMLRNRRVGTSVSGVAQFLAARSLQVLRDWLRAGYARIEELDKELSDQFCVPLSIKRTTVKPSGTVSLLARATPGMHFPISNYYIRRVTFSKTSPLLDKLRGAGYKVEESVYDKQNSVIVEFPGSIGDDVRCLKDVSMWEQLSLAALLQKDWSDNQVSATITFDKAHEGPHIARALDYYQYQLKGISFLPSTESSNTYSLPGRLPAEHAREQIGPIFDDAIDAAYDPEKDATLLTFRPEFASSALVEHVLTRLRAAGYDVGSKAVAPYAQMPYEEIDRGTYETLMSNIRPVQWHDDTQPSPQPSDDVSMDIPAELQFCDGDRCVI